MAIKKCLWSDLEAEQGCHLAYVSLTLNTILQRVSGIQIAA